MRVEGHINDLYGNIHDCMLDFFQMHKLSFHNFFNHIQHIYYVYGVPYLQVAAIGQISSYNIWHYGAKAFTA